MHHCRDTDAADLSESYAELGLYVSLECSIAGLKTLMDHVGRICPDAVDELVFPFEIAGCYRQMILVDKYCFDTCGTQFDSQCCSFEIHGGASLKELLLVFVLTCKYNTLNKEEDTKHYAYGNVRPPCIFET